MYTCLVCGGDIPDARFDSDEPLDTDFCSESCERSYLADQDDEPEGLLPGEDMDGDAESALESVYGPTDEGQYDEAF